MEHDHRVAMLNRLKLTAIRDQLDSLVGEAARRELAIREALSLFREREIGRKDERRIEMSVGLARFPFVRDLDGFDFAAQPSIDKKQIREIAAGRFIANAAAVLPDPRSRLPDAPDPSRAKNRASSQPQARNNRFRGSHGEGWYRVRGVPEPAAFWATSIRPTGEICLSAGSSRLVTRGMDAHRERSPGPSGSRINIGRSFVYRRKGSVGARLIYTSSTSD
jgi:IstB-like ATP binding protein